MVDTKRRGLIGLGIASLAAPALAQTSAGSIRMVVPYPPGGASDVIARLMSQPMTEILSQTVVVENRPGANGGIAAELVSRAAPDGTTLLMGNAGPNALNQALYGRRLNYDSVNGFTPISLVSSVPLVMGVFLGFPPRNLPEIIAYARQRPGEVNYASGGIGTASDTRAAWHNFQHQLGERRLSWWTGGDHRGDWRTGAGHHGYGAGCAATNPRRPHPCHCGVNPQSPHPGARYSNHCGTGFSGF